MRKMWINKHGLRFKIMILPMILMSAIIIFVSLGAIETSKKALMQQMEMDGIQLAEQVASEIENSYYALEALNNISDEKILQIGSFIGKNQNRLSNDFLKELSQDLGVDEINVTDKDGLIIFSNLDSSIGAVFGPDHIAYQVISLKEATLIEKIRKSRETGNYFKYGYVKLPGDGIVQIGLLANKIEEMKKDIDQGALMNKVSSKEHIEYAFVSDNNGIIVSSNLEDRIGTKLKGDNIDDIISKGLPYASLFKEDGVFTYDMFVPLKINEEQKGYVLVGLKMDTVDMAIARNIKIAIGIAILGFVVFGAVLYFVSKKIMDVMQDLVIVSKSVSQGNLDFKMDVKADDETGILASNFKEMIESLKLTISTMKDQSLSTEEISNQLNAVVKEISMSTQNIAETIQELSMGNNSQADNLEKINDTMRRFSDRIEEIVQSIQDMNNSAGHVNIRVKESYQKIEKVIVSFRNTRDAFNELRLKISAVGNNVTKINEITELINQVSEQTNLLALNASIEAARAGESGRGFAVVADEIRKLAEQTRLSSSDIDSLIQNIGIDTKDMINTTDLMKNEIDNQRTDINEAKDSFGNIMNDMDSIIPKMESINKNALQIDSQSDEIKASLDEISNVAKDVSLMSEEIASSSQQVSAVTIHVGETADTLSEMTKDMKSMVDKFKI